MLQLQDTYSNHSHYFFLAVLLAGLLVYELVHHYQVDQSLPSYHALTGEQRLVAWANDAREYEARFIALAYTRPDLTGEEIRFLIDQENKAICEGDLSVVKTGHQ